MVKIEVLLRKGIVGRIGETELERYISFFRESCEDNARHAEANMASYPRWSIISGYYAMHDATKLFLSKSFRIKIDFEVHSTTIKVLKELIDNKEILNLIERGYKEFLSLANDLAEAKKNRVKMQYYTGTKFMKEEYSKKAEEFHNAIVLVYLEKIRRLL